jgi:hypothetical protein
VKKIKNNGNFENDIKEMKNFIGILFNDIENIYKEIKNINYKVDKLKIKFENYEKERNIKNIIKKKKKEVND